MDDSSSQDSTGKSSLRHDPAVETTYMAATRTLLALVRTGAAIAGGGAVVTSLLVQGWSRWVVVAVSSAFVILGYWLIWAAMKKGREMRRRFEREFVGQFFMFPHREVTFVTLGLQILIAVVVVLYLVRH